MRSQCQINFCNTLKYKTKPQNLGKKRCEALPNERSIKNITKKCLKRIPTLSSIQDCSKKSHLATMVIMFLNFTEYLSCFLFCSVFKPASATDIKRTAHCSPTPCSTDCYSPALHADFSFVNWDLEYFHKGKADQWFFKRAKQFCVMNISWHGQLHFFTHKKAKNTNTKKRL